MEKNFKTIGIWKYLVRVTEKKILLTEKNSVILAVKVIPLYPAFSTA
jgi:hypothetical protein